jgi:hypothetical protein
LLRAAITASLLDAVLFSANAVLTSLLNFVSSNTTTVFNVVLNLAHAQIQQIVTAYLLAM